MNYTQAEIFDAICFVVGDDGTYAKKTLFMLNDARKKYGKLTNKEYSKSRKDFEETLKKIKE